MYVGIDAVDIHRMRNLAYASHWQLRRIFTEHEIAYCFAESTLTLSRLATRFAAKEATWKALSQYTSPPAFLTLCRNTEIILHHGLRLCIPMYPGLNTSVSLTHTNTTATAIVIVSPVTHV